MKKSLCFERVRQTNVWALSVLASVLVMGALEGVAFSATKGAQTSATAPRPVTQDEADQIALEAYTYLYPLISMDVTRQVMTSPESAGRPGAGPMNAFTHMRALPDAKFRDVVRPNFDTLYSSAWLDLTQEPMVVSHGDTKGRYFLLPMLDMWTDAFAVPGKRTTGTQPWNFLVTPPGWQGQVPAGLTQIPASTPYVWVIGRTQTNGVNDYPAVHALQDTYRVTPLSQWGKAGEQASAQNVTSVGAASGTSAFKVDLKKPPAEFVNTMPADRYFAYGASLMALHRPHLADWSQIARFEKIGLIPGQDFDIKKTPPIVRKALERATKQGLAAMQKRLPTMSQSVNGWQMNTESMGVYGINYLKRAVVALVGLGANQSEDAIYPLALTDSKGQKLMGDKRYVIRFEKEALPPVDGFWSLTMYDQQGYQVANPLNRFAIGDRDALKFGKDGSLEILIQSTSPGADKESNWLPSPASGELGLTMRLYAPRAAALNGTWQPPAISEVPAPTVQ